ncbi:MAG: von Willebrand factor type A domain-containing protein, partial [Planctomycetota bacterium]
MQRSKIKFIVLVVWMGVAGLIAWQYLKNTSPKKNSLTAQNLHEKEDSVAVVEKSPIKETLPPLETKTSLVKDSVVSDSEASDHNETSNREEFQQAKGSESSLSDKPFDGSYLTDSIGVGGGGNPGRLGGKFGGKKNLVRGSASSEEISTESYQNYGINGRTETAQDSLSTFAIDVDTASYTIARLKFNTGQFPPKDAVRIEEFINFFSPEFPKNREEWFQVHIDSTPSLFRSQYHLMRIVVQGKDIFPEERKPANLVFLVDISGSMSGDNRIGLVQRSLCLLTDSLMPQDYISLC